MKKPKAFTLIELLVVVAIISVLAAMLLPALQKAKDTGMQIRCVGNIRQVAMAMLMYVDDNNSYLPCVRDPSLGYDYGGWMYQIASYLRANMSSIPRNSVLYCPVEARDPQAGANKRFFYAMNHDLRYNGAVSNPQATKKISQVVSVSKAMAFTENGMYEDVLHVPFLEYGFYGHPAGYSVAGPSHGGKGVSIAYVDGHAEFWRRIPPPNEYTVDPSVPWTHKLFWGMPAAGASSANGSWGTATAPYNP